MNKRTLLIVLGLVVLVGGWALFRPEKLFVNKTVNEVLPGGTGAQAATASSTTVTLATGRFHGVAHESRGLATVLRLPDGKRILRLTEFQTSNGPELHLYAFAADDATDSDTVKKAGFVDLGELKGNQGDQNYDLPGDLDLGKYRSVTVWCRRFGVNFATAPLSAGPGAAMGSTPEPLFAGRFHGVAHDGKGLATVYQLADGRRILRLTEFETSNGPELQLYLVAAADATDSDTVKKAGFVTLGALKGNIGDQNYEIPADVDFGKYQSVTVWCRRFGVNFATAPLSRQ